MEENTQVLEYIKKAFELKEEQYYKPAIEMLYKALESENDNIEILYQIGELYFLMNNYSRALQYIEKVLKNSPKHIESLKLKRIIKKRQNEFDNVLNISQQLFEIDPNSENLKELIDILINLKLFTEIEKYKSSEFFNSEVKITCANAFYTNGEFEQANKLLQECDEDNEQVLLLKGKIAFDNHNEEEAKNIFSRISQNTQNPEILNFLGLFDIENMNFIEAIKHFSKASNIDKSNSKYLHNLGNAYFFNGWFEEAKKAYSKALYILPNNTDYRYSLAYLYYDNKDFSKSKQEIDAILELDPQHSQANVLKALLLYEKKDFLGAKRILEENLKNGYQDDFTKMSLSKVYLELNIFEKAKNLVNEVIDKNPENLNYLSDLAEISIKEKQYDEALKITQKILTINPNYIAGYILGAKISYLKEDYEKTKYYAQETISLDLNCAQGYYYLALSREKMNDVDEAIECMKRAILYDLNNPKYYAAMSDLYKSKQNYKAALDYISEAENLDNTNQYKFAYSELVKLNRKK